MQVSARFVSAGRAFSFILLRAIVVPSQLRKAKTKLKTESSTSISETVRDGAKELALPEKTLRKLTYLSNQST